LSEVRQNGRIIFHLHDCLGSRKAPRNSISFREKRLITRFFGSPSLCCDKLVDLFSGSDERSESGEAPHNSFFLVRLGFGATNELIYFFAWMIGPGRKKRLITCFFGSFFGSRKALRLDFFGSSSCRTDKLADLFFRLGDWSGSGKAPHDSIFRFTLSKVRQISRFFSVWVNGPGREKRLITRFFGSPCLWCDK